MNKPQIDRQAIEDAFPLSAIQRGMAYLSQQHQDRSVYHNQLIFQLKDLNFAPDLLERALILLSRRHGMLRTGFLKNKQGRWMQVVLRDVQPRYRHLDLSPLTEPRQEKAIRRFLERDKERPFDLESGQILWRAQTFDVGEGEICLVWICHHAMLDGWSGATLTTELNDTYLRLKKDPNITLPAMKSSYKLYVAEQLAQTENPAALEFWRRELADYRRFAFPSPAAVVDAEARRRRAGKELGQELGQGLRSRAKEFGLSLKSLCFTAYMGALSMFSYDNDICAGLITNNRPVCADAERMIGCFLNTVPTRLKFPWGADWLTGARQADALLRRVKAFDMIPLFDIAQALGETGRDGNPMCDVIFNFVDFFVYNQARQGLLGASGRRLAVRGAGDTNTWLDVTVESTGRRFELVLAYAPQFVGSETVEAFGDYFQEILTAFWKRPHEQARKEALLRPEEKRTLLETFNQTATPFPADASIPQLLEEQVNLCPDRIALCHRDGVISYQELWRRSTALAGELQSRGLRPYGIVALLADRSLEMMIGIMGILCGGGAYLPLDPKTPPQRKLYMIRDCAAALALTHEPYFGELKGEVECVDLSSRGAAVPPVEVADLPAYVIYTSGTTGKPKGAVVVHRAVIRLVKKANYITIEPPDRMLQLANVAFDGSVFDIFGALLNGACLVLAPGGSAMSLAELGHLIVSEAVTLFFITTALFNALLDWDPQCLSGVRHVLFGGEKASRPHCDKGFETLGPGRLINMYGPTEATVYATAYPLLELPPDGQALPIGGPVSNTTLFVLDALRQPVPIGTAGELYIGGPGLVRGYVNRPELTAERFVSVDWAGGERLYRSGDLVRWLPDGVLDYVGRIDTQVKIRGFRVETAEIEWALCQLPEVREAVVEPFDGHGGTIGLCAYMTGESRSISVEEIKRKLGTQLPDFMIPAHLRWLDSIPLNANGKVDRKALPQPEPDQPLEIVEPRNEWERSILEIWAEVLGGEVDRISIQRDFFDLGGHSLKATQLVARLQRDLQADISLVDLFQHPTVEGLAELIRGGRPNRANGVPAAEKRDYYPLSGAQKRLHLLQQLQPEATVYNVPTVIAFEDGVEPQALQRALGMLVETHDSLRARFPVLEDQPVQRIAEHMEVSLPVTDLDCDHFPYGEILGRHTSPFDSAVAPLWRVHLFRLASGACYLFWDIHHIITDGVSQGILKRDLFALLQGREVPVPKRRYVDVALWREQEGQQEVSEAQTEFWRRLFDPLPAPLELPMDVSRPPVQVYQGASVTFALHREEEDALRRMARDCDCTVFMVVMAVFQTLLATLSRQEDIVVGVPVAGRRSADVEGIVGMFVNTLPFRFRPRMDISWRDFLAEVREGTLQAFDHQDLQFEELVELLDIQRDTGRGPLFDVMLNVLDGHIHGAAGHGKPGIHRRGIAKFDLSLFVVDDGRRLDLGFEYCTRLLSPRTIDAMTGYFRGLVRQVGANPGSRLRDLDIVGPEERDMVVRQFNRTEVELPERLSMALELNRQAQAHPDRVALYFEDIQLSYEILNRRVAQLALSLRHHGVGADSIVAVHMERSPHLVTAILAVIAAGGAYLALAADNPYERTRFILRDSGAALLLRAGAGEKKEGGPLVMDVTDSRLYDATVPASAPMEHGPHDLFHVFYTSGSTGTPKGVLVENRGVVNLLRYVERKFPMGERGVFMFKTNCMFDVSVSELFGWTLGAGGVAVLPQGHEKDPVLIARAVGRHRVTHIDFVPSMLTVFLQYLEPAELALLGALRYVLVGGEEFSRDLADTVLRSGLDVTVANLYGPTETTVYSTAYFLPRHGETGPVPIGAPVDNVTHYIVEADSDNRPVPPLMAGELVIGGVGVGRGYLNRPELTHQRFGRDPFSDGGRVYRSGDLCRWRWNGVVDYLGRIDYQVKIRGNRVELGEIENCLAQHPAVKAAVVTVVKEGGTDPAIAAYIIPAAAEIPGPEEVKEFVASMLPSYMVPSYVTVLESFPRSSSGIIARRLLPAPDMAVEEVAVPTDPLELDIRRLFAAVLDIPLDRVGRDSNFFALGGHSLKATVLTARLKRELGLNMELLDVFSHPSVGRLAVVARRSVAADVLLVHDGTGGVEGYGELCALLDPNLVCRGVPAPPPGEFEGEGVDIETLAGNYLKRIAPLSSSTVIVGWSLGATIGFEMARQLREQGRWSGALVLIDGLPPLQAREHRDTTPDVPEDKPALLKRFPIFRQPAYAGASIEELSGLALRLRALNRAREDYVPATMLDTPVVCVCASESTFVDHQLWSRHITGPLQYLTIDGDHFSLLRPPAARELAAVLERCKEELE